MNEETDLFNIAELCIKLDISRPTFIKWFKEVEPIKIAGLEKFYSMSSIQTVLAARKAKAQKEESSRTYQNKETAETRKLVAQAEKLEMEVQKIKGSLVRVEDVIAPIADSLHSVKSKILNISIRLAPHISTDQRKILDGFINECLSEIAATNLDGLFNGETKATGTTEASIPENETPGKIDSQPVGGAEQTT